jgi:hypothetical protein
MRMAVDQRGMAMPVRVGFGHHDVRIMGVLMVLVVHVSVLMLQILMGVVVFVTLGEMQP